MVNPLLVGITGGSGSGKTFILEKIREKFSIGELSLISQDNYYHPIDKQLVDKNGVENFDIPASIDHEAFISDVTKLKNGETVSRTEYMFNNNEATPSKIIINPASIIIVEGIFVFHIDEIRNQLDLKVFIDAPEEVMLKRRIKRDAEERGYDKADVTYRFENHVLPAYQSYILPYKKEASHVIENLNENYKSGLESLILELKQKKPFVK